MEGGGRRGVGIIPLERAWNTKLGVSKFINYKRKILQLLYGLEYDSFDYTKFSILRWHYRRHSDNRKSKNWIICFVNL